ncbi:hypothetical protein AK830_g4743 [Neonectria ditissima]|uniref:Uncharacterized protein n=1 Tax=Neonectria ditissima TaxID=78410 RepID=A0A0P7BMV0_9HYPO|nr:hypothetical protein AK830_g4743 [Neonectria ditissima]
MSMNLISTYHSSPNFSITPPDANGPLHLGSVITDLRDPVALNPSIRVSIPEDEIMKTHLTGYSTTLKRSPDPRWGILTGLSGLSRPVAQQGTVQGRSYNEELVTKLLETHYFNPSSEYIEESINLQPVKAFRNASHDKLPVFLVTGIKIARGASIRIAKGMSVGGSAHIDATGGVTGLMTAGPFVSAQLTTNQEMNFDESSDFVLAYRVTRVRWKKGEVKSKAYTSGATIVDDDCGSASMLFGYVDFIHNFTDQEAAN